MVSSIKKHRKNSALVYAIIPAAGVGRRLQSKTPKPLVHLKNKPIIVRTIQALMSAHRFDRIIIPTDPSTKDGIQRAIFKYSLERAEVILGGRTRAESVRKSYEYLDSKRGIVLIHDAARPFINKKLVKKQIKTANIKGTSLLAINATSTVKLVDLKKKVVSKTLNRDQIFLAQTPQVFKVSVLERAYKIVGDEYERFTDEAALVESSGQKVSITEGSAMNIKITTPEDLVLANQFLKSSLVERLG